MLTRTTVANLTRTGIASMAKQQQQHPEQTPPLHPPPDPDNNDHQDHTTTTTARPMTPQSPDTNPSASLPDPDTTQTPTTPPEPTTETYSINKQKMIRDLVFWHRALGHPGHVPHATTTGQRTPEAIRQKRGTDAYLCGLHDW